VALAAPQQQVAAGRRNTAVRKQRVGTQRVRHSLGTQYANSSFSVGDAAASGHRGIYHIWRKHWRRHWAGCARGGCARHVLSTKSRLLIAFF
jgi:hypothetical protein